MGGQRLTKQQVIRAGISAPIVGAVVTLSVWITESWLSDQGKLREQVQESKSLLLRLETQVDDRWIETNRRLAHIEAMLDELKKR